MTDVLIIGAGPIGLTLAALLRRQDVGVVVLEAHPGLSRHPKARGISARSMETFRMLGIERSVRTAGLPPQHIRFFRAETLDADVFEMSEVPTTQARGNTPAAGVLCSQDRLEPVLLEHALARGAEVRFGHRVTGIDQDADGVNVSYICPDGDGSIRARYVVGCDGARSIARRATGITMSGEKGLARFLSIRFHAPLADVVRDRTAASYFLTGGRGGFLAIDNREHWIYQYPVPDDCDIEAIRSDVGALSELIRSAAGIERLPVEVADTMLWRMDARLADRYRAGRVLLAGDAAHLTPPTGGHGMNVGIGDADTLSWVLAAVAAGRAPASLLDRYELERRPVAATVIAISSDNAGRRYAIDDEILLSTHYGATPPVSTAPYAPSGTPGRRLPHVGLRGDARTTSTLDLLRPCAVLLTETPDQRWLDAAAGHGIPVIAVHDGNRMPEAPGAFRAKTGLAAGGSLLVRPDGHIAARFDGSAHSELGAAVAELLR